MPRYIRYKRYKQQVNLLNCNDINKWTDTCNYRLGSYVDICSTDCNCGDTEGTEPILQYRWINLNPNYSYYCEGNDRYYKQRKEVSYDNGVTWMYNIPDEYRKGALYEANSRFCTSDSIIRKYVPFEGSEPYCDGYTKIQKLVRVISFDGGHTWEELVWNKPDGTEYKEIVERVIENNSCDCGYESLEFVFNGVYLCGSEIGTEYERDSSYEVWEEEYVCSKKKTGRKEYRNPQPSYECKIMRYEWKLIEESVCGSEVPKGAEELTDKDINNQNN